MRLSASSVATARSDEVAHGSLPRTRGRLLPLSFQQQVCLLPAHELLLCTHKLLALQLVCAEQATCVCLSQQQRLCLWAWQHAWVPPDSTCTSPKAERQLTCMDAHVLRVGCSCALWIVLYDGLFPRPCFSHSVAKQLYHRQLRYISDGGGEGALLAGCRHPAGWCGCCRLPTPLVGPATHLVDALDGCSLQRLLSCREPE